MMDIQEAIRRIKDHRDRHKLYEPRAIHISKALDTAIDALQEKSMREKGCEYCDPKNISLYYAGNVPNFCKHCGRKLEGYN